MKGLFKLKNSSKYRGNPTNIVWRSSWELKYMMKLDNDPNIIEWSSEEIAVPYQSPLDNNIHRYFPDFRVKDNTGHTYLVEIKPAKETVQPVHKSTMRRFLKESATFAINLKKWEAARRYCEQRGWSFKILTEIELGIPQRG